MLRQFVRGIQMVSTKAGPQQMRMVQSMNHMNQAMNQMAIINYQQREFSKKKKSKKGGEGTATEDEAEDASPTIMDTLKDLRSADAAKTEAAPAKATPPPPKAAPKATPPPPKMSGGFYSVGDDVKRIDSVPDNKPPSAEDSIEGRYAGVLFTTASQQGALFTVFEDISYIYELYKNSETFRLFTQNGGVGRREINKFNEALQSVATFHPLTIKFLEVLAENKRLVYIDGIATRYVKLYQQFNKEEKITIISAETLTAGEEGEVLAALQANPQNEGKQFQLEFTIDASIKGGLQMYTETEFMDMSLASRLNKLEGEMARLVE